RDGDLPAAGLEVMPHLVAAQNRQKRQRKTERLRDQRRIMHQGLAWSAEIKPHQMAGALELLIARTEHETRVGGRQYSERKEQHGAPAIALRLRILGRRHDLRCGGSLELVRVVACHEDRPARKSFKYSSKRARAA